MKPIDADTGEVLIEQTIYRRENEVVVSFDPSHSRRNIKHVRVRTAREQRRVYEKLSLDERGFLFSLLPYLEWETNIVCGDGEIEEQGKPLKMVQIDAIVGISKPNRIKIVQSLVAKRVLGYLMTGGKKTALLINPQYALRGRKPDDALKKSFVNDEEIEGDDAP